MRAPFLSNDLAHNPVDLVLVHDLISRPRSLPGLRKDSENISFLAPTNTGRMAPWDGRRPDPHRRGSWRHSTISAPHSPSYRPPEPPPYPSDHSTHPQWDSVPVPFHPLDMPPSSAAPDPLFSWRLRQGESASGQHMRPPGRTRHRHRPPPAVRLENMQGLGDAPGNARSPDLSLLYPQLSPYDDRSLAYSAPDQLESPYRSFSQPNPPAFDQSQPHMAEPPLYLNPRSPTYPPATQFRSRRATDSREATFDDESEFHLFAEATAGLGPMQAFHRNSSSPPSHGHEARTERGHVPEPTEPQYLSSPVQETPTTMFALQQLAQMPQGSRLQRQQPGTDIEAWLQSTHHSEEFDLDEDETGFMEDELPDYAASQAQAQAAQRIEATRRAQELQRRWQQSRYGEG